MEKAYALIARTTVSDSGPMDAVMFCQEKPFQLHRFHHISFLPKPTKRTA
jgi:hypothetical protein